MLISLVFIMLFTSSVNTVLASAVAFPSPDVPYTEDPEVNFVGKTDARAVQFLNWTLQNYEWACYTDNPAITAPPNDPNANDPKSTNTRKCQNDKNPLIGFWKTIRNIVYALFALIILITAFILIVSRGKSLTLKRFLPRFVAVVLLVTLSYALIQFIYTTVDIFQGFFLTKPPSTAGGPRELINSLDLLYVGWDYEYFRGLRKVHPFFDESVFVNLLLARLTAVTYYAMTGVLIIRKIILWFFIVLSPIFPILLLYYPVRNTAKIWIGEFFRWLMYAPLFAVFLSGLVSVWKSPRLPLIFDFTNVGKSFVYPTATNVLLGGPGQVVTAENNLNTPDTFALYVVALIMLWVVILLPFILLQIFLDYLNNFSFTDSPAMQKLINTSYLLLNKTPPSPTTPVPPPANTGMAKQLPFGKFGAAQQIPITQEGPKGAAKQLPIAMPMGEALQQQSVKPLSSAQAHVNTEILNATNISIPTIRDIASFERQIIANRESSNVSQTYEALRQISNPQIIQNQITKEKYVKIKERIIQESKSGNNVATSILKASNVASNVSTQNVNNIRNLRKNLTKIANPQSVTAKDSERVTKLHDSLVKESQQGNTLATSILASKETMSTKEVQDLKEKLIDATLKGDRNATDILTNSVTQINTQTTQKIIQQLANTSTIADTKLRERYDQVKEKIIEEQKQGNPLATSLLSSMDSSSKQETALGKNVNTKNIENLKEKIIEAKDKKDHLAGELLSLFMSEASVPEVTAVPQASRIQSVSTEDYEAVKKMWQENYKGLDVPEGLTDRNEWVTDDLTDINRILSLLTSNDEQHIQEGMQEVGTVLPFLMLGGFSQEEIVAYLKAKRDAAKTVVDEMAKEEETLVTVETHTAAHAAKAQTATVDDTEEEASPIDNVAVASLNENANLDLLNLTNLPTPTIRDLVKYETALQTESEDAKERQNQILHVLRVIKNPELATNNEEKVRIDEIIKTLQEKSNQGDMHAKLILQAAHQAASSQDFTQKNPVTLFHQYLLELGHPELYPSSSNNDDLKKIHEELVNEMKNKNVLADKILLVTDQTPQDQIEGLRDVIRNESDSGNPLAQRVWQFAPKESVMTSQAEGLGSISLPENNPIQLVDVNDYESVRSMWEDFYHKSESPSGYNSKKEWLTKESSNIHEINMLLTSNDQTKVQQGLNQVSSLLSFVLLGGFSLSEITAYLDAKEHAANSVLQAITNNESSDNVLVDNKPTREENTKKMEVDVQERLDDADKK